MTDEVIAKQSIADEVGIPLPRYISHKKVYALKIGEMAVLQDVAGVRVVFADERYGARLLSFDWYMRVKQGEDQGYYVVYEDGFESWSPTKAFEEGYSTWPPIDSEAG